MTNNRAAGPVTSVPEGGGIYSPGPLTVDQSDIVANEAHGQPPNGRGAVAGGIWADETGLTIRHSSISGNRAVFESRWPIGDDPDTIGGGVFVQGDFTLHPDVRATIEHSRIEGNEARASNPIGDAIAFSGGVHGNGAVSITDSVVAHNRAIAVIPPGSPAKAAADSAAGNLNVGALIDHVRFVDNTVLADAPDGTAIGGAGGLFAFQTTPSTSATACSPVIRSPRSGTRSTHSAPRSPTTTSSPCTGRTCRITPCARSAPQATPTAAASGTAAGLTRRTSRRS